MVVLGAQTLESVRILLNSSNPHHPNGLANSSGVLGHYLMDHIFVGGDASAEFDGLSGKPSMNGPKRPDGIYVVRFRNTLRGPRSKKFLRGYGYQGSGAVNFKWDAPGFGKAYKRGILDLVTTVGVGAFGECLARWDNYVEIDPNVAAIFGIPVLRIHMKYGSNEHAMIDDTAESAAEMMEAAGGKNIHAFKVHDRKPGHGIHEVGIARMGNDPKRSVLNQFQQSHDIKNLFVVGRIGVYFHCLSESYTHHDGALGALLRLPHGADADGRHLIPFFLGGKRLG